MSSRIKFSVSGIRGPAPNILTPELCVTAARAFAKYCGNGKIIVGTDTRKTRALLREAIITGLSASGCNILDAGIIPTPTLSVLIREHKADGGIMITASHNPEPDNGLKFMNGKGLFLNESAVADLKMIFFEANFIKTSPTIPKTLENPFGPHLSKIIGEVDVASIGSRSFLVALDSVNGAGSAITLKLLKDLGCRVVSINTNMDIGFPRAALEPTPENIGDLCELVKRKKADIGFVQDPDADRLAIVSDEGIAVGEEFTLALAMAHVLKNRSRGANRTVVSNLSTTRAIDDIAALNGVRSIRTKIGEINVAEEMIRSGAVIGGEGNGGVIYPPITMNRDSLTGMALTLEYMAKSGSKISELCRGLPQYSMVKTKVACSSQTEQERIMRKAEELAMGKTVDRIDGVKIFLDGGAWIHIRASNTEHAVRVIAEARDKKKAEKIVSDFLGT